MVYNLNLQYTYLYLVATRCHTFRQAFVDSTRLFIAKVLRAHKDILLFTYYNLDTILGGALLSVHLSSLLISNRASIKSATATSLQLPVPPASQPEGISLPFASLRGGGLSCQPKWPPQRVLTTTTFGFSRQWLSFRENWPTRVIASVYNDKILK